MKTGRPAGAVNLCTCPNVTTLLLALLLIVLLVAGWMLTLVGLPGNWLMVGTTAVYAWLVPAQSRAAIGWKVVAAMLVLAVLGEVVELLAGALGAARAGGSRRGAALALVGSLAGALVGAVVGLPIPLVGSLVRRSPLCRPGKRWPGQLSENCGPEKTSTQAGASARWPSGDALGRHPGQDPHRAVMMRGGACRLGGVRPKTMPNDEHTRHSPCSPKPDCCVGDAQKTEDQGTQKIVFHQGI